MMMRHTEAVHPHESLFVGNPLSIFMLTWQAAMIVIFATSTKFADDYMPANGTNNGTNKMVLTRYPMFQDTHVMIAVGIGFLYSLMRRYAWTAVGLNFLLHASCFQWAILCNGFWTNVRYTITGEHEGFPAFPLNLEVFTVRIFSSMHACLQCVFVEMTCCDHSPEIDPRRLCSCYCSHLLWRSTRTSITYTGLVDGIP